MSDYLSCGLCCVALKPNTQCDHGQFLYKEWETTETETIILKKSIFGDKTSVDVTKTQHKACELKCRCGFKHNLEDHAMHVCTYDGVKNIMKLTYYDGPPLHPSGLNHRKHCQACKGTGHVAIHRYKPCPNCLGTGGLKCSTCCGTGKKYSYQKKHGTYYCECTAGYSEPCQICMGQQAVRNGFTEIPCTKCIACDIVPRVRPINAVCSNISAVQDISKLNEVCVLVAPPSPSQQARVIGALAIEAHK
jgi:hypothetical protein